MYKALGITTFFLAWFGIIGPACVSASSDALVIGWFLSTGILAVASIKIIVRKLKEAQK